MHGPGIANIKNGSGPGTILTIHILWSSKSGHLFNKETTIQ